MKQLTFLTAMFITLTLMSFSCNKEDDVPEESSLTFEEYFSGSWELTECKTDGVLTPCGTTLYPFTIHSDMARQIVLYTKLRFDTINDQIITTNCNNQDYTVAYIDWGPTEIPENQIVGVPFYSNYSPWGLITIQPDNNTFSMDLGVTYVWASMVEQNEYADRTHVCKFRKIEK